MEKFPRGAKRGALPHERRNVHYLPVGEIASFLIFRVLGCARVRSVILSFAASDF
jgi:hypothetical protein